MNQIFKFPLTSSLIRVKGHLTGNFFSAQMQNGVPCVWTEVNEIEDQTTWEFWVVGTGHPYPDADSDIIFINTVIDGAFVWHVFGKLIVGSET